MSQTARTRPAVLAAAIACFAAALPAAAQVSVETRRIGRSTDLYDMAVAYPATGVAAIDDAIAGWAARQVDDFAELATEPFAVKYSLDVDFDVARNDDEMFSVAFTISDYLGGAHPNLRLETFNFALPDGWRVFLPEVFKPAALERISALAIDDLRGQMSGPDAMTDEDWLKEGAGPRWDNFASFVLLPQSLVVRFPPYQVAAYAAGPQQVEIPLYKLAGLLREDWRVPVPSFDCARALSDAYARSLGYANESTAGAIRSAQRAWLRERNACGGDVACLSTAYEERLSAL